jgi:lipid-A-disaccharide synthase
MERKTASQRFFLVFYPANGRLKKTADSELLDAFRPEAVCCVVNNLWRCLPQGQTRYDVASAERAGARMSEPTSIFISAGEASGEHYGALLVDELRRRLAAAGQTASFIGMGGQRMADSGLERVARSEDMAVMGITEVVRHLPRIYREFRRLKAAIRARRPSVAVLIDFPDIHFRLAAEFHRLGIPVVFFVSPQLWAWKKKRIRLVQRYVDRMLVIFPFEEQFYRDHNVRAEFVGHPLAELPLPSISREQFARDNALDPARSWIGLLPGSRAREIVDNLPETLAAARILATRPPHGTGPGLEFGPEFSPEFVPEFQFLLPVAPTLKSSHRRMLRDLVERHGSDLPVYLLDDARAALFHARASVVASGTATVEAALIGKPFVVVYRVSPITYEIAKRVVKVPYVAMVNLIAGKLVVPELIQKAFTAPNIVSQIEPLLPEGPPRESMMKELARIRSLLAPGNGATEDGAIARVAAITMDLAGAFSPIPESVQS